MSSESKIGTPQNVSFVNKMWNPTFSRDYGQNNQFFVLLSNSKYKNFRVCITSKYSFDIYSPTVDSLLYWNRLYHLQKMRYWIDWTRLVKDGRDHFLENHNWIESKHSFWRHETSGFIKSIQNQNEILITHVQVDLIFLAIFAWIIGKSCPMKRFFGNDSKMEHVTALKPWSV